MSNAVPEDYLRQEAINDLEQYKKDTLWQPATGCWIDGHWGIYAMTRLIEIAQDYGFVISDDDELAIQEYKNGEYDFELNGEMLSTMDWVWNTSDDAEEWLNQNVAWPGLSFGWVDGEFFYMDNSWWEDSWGM